MSKYSAYSKRKREYYEKMLKDIGSLSRLFSENDSPYLDSRIVENLYCKSFEAVNKGREDSSVDAVFGKTGIGIKTFVGKGAQKVAEFNKDILTFRNLKPLKKAKRIAALRNKRIEFTKRNYDLDELKYHCIIREKNKMRICEEPMDLINITKLKLLKSTPKSLSFNDGNNDYNFNVSKSVLLKKFDMRASAEIKVKILENPFELLAKSLTGPAKGLFETRGIEYPYVVLPLYTIIKKVKGVPKRSALNQWNAKGRPRNENEIYIKIPAWIHRKYAGFFPARDKPFKLKLPNGKYLLAKICQDGSKALMSNPNKALGQWLLRDVLALRKRKLLTYKMLQEIGIDSVIIKKIRKLKYSIDFRDEGEFEKFEEISNA